MGQLDPEQSSSNYGLAVGNNAPYDWRGWMFLLPYPPAGLPSAGGRSSHWVHAGGDHYIEYLELLVQILHHM